MRKILLLLVLALFFLSTFAIKADVAKNVQKKKQNLAEVQREMAEADFLA